MTEAEKIYEAEKACFEHCWTLQNVESQLKSDSNILCTVGDKVLSGYVFGNIVCDEAELYRIAVMPEQRHSGLGQALMDMFISECRSRGAVKIFLEVRSKNAPAISLYERNGFKRIHVRKNYYGDDDAAVYLLEL